MTKLIRVPGSASGSTTYTLAPGESWSLDALVFTLAAPIGSGQTMPTLTLRTQGGDVIGKITAPIFFA